MDYSKKQTELDVKKWLETRDDDNPNNYDGGFVLKETNEVIGCIDVVDFCCIMDHRHYSPPTVSWSTNTLGMPHVTAHD